jgi:hypothetical protein
LEDVPAGADPCYAFGHPGDAIWEYKAYEYDEVLVGYDKHPHGEPNEAVYRYSVRLPQEHQFAQAQLDAVYWLSVVAVYIDSIPMTSWGWTNHSRYWDANAVVGSVLRSEPDVEWTWDELLDQTGAGADMSFILFTDYDPISGTCWDPTECGAQWCGDVSCDGSVNFLDLGLLKVAFWSAKGDPRYNCCADFDHDGKVDFVDLGIMKGAGIWCWGVATGNQSCPP